MPLLDAIFLGSALVLACAVCDALPLRGRGANGSGPRARPPRPAPHDDPQTFDPYAWPFGDVVARPDDGGRVIPSDAPAGRRYRSGGADV